MIIAMYALGICAIISGCLIWALVHSEAMYDPSSATGIYNPFCPKDGEK